MKPDPSITFHSENREILRITHDGRLVCGEGLSVDAATQEAAKLLIQAFEQEIQKMLDARAADKAAKAVNAASFTTGKAYYAAVRAAIDKAMKEASK